MEKKSLAQKIRAVFSDALVYLSEQKVVFAATFLAFVSECLYIYDVEKFSDKIYYGFFEELCYGFAMGAVFAIPATLLSKRFSALKKYAFQIALALGGGLLGFFSKSEGFGDDVYSELYYFGIGFAVIASSLFLFIPKENPRAYFALVFKHFLFCALMSLVLLGGLCLLVYAVQNLILGTSENEIYTCCLAFSFLIFAINSFVFHLFYRRNEESSGRAFKIIVLYILLPVFAVLLLILYAYLLKALVLMELPNGQINWFVSVASCVYIVFFFILREYDDLPAVRFFYRFGAFAFLPLICVQIYAYAVRVGAYGFTGYRYSSLLFIVFSVLTILSTFFKKGKFTKYSLLLLSALILFDSVTPFNLINMAYKSQYGRMMNVLKKYELFDFQNERLASYDSAALESAITDEDRETLYSSYWYIRFTSHISEPEWFFKEVTTSNGKQKEELSFEELFGIKQNREDESIKHFHISGGGDKYTIDISGFRQMNGIHEYGNSHGKNEETGKWETYAHKIKEISVPTQNGDYDLTEFFLSLVSDDHLKENQSKTGLWYTPDEKTAFYFTSLDFQYNEDRALFRDYDFSAWVFYR